MSEVPVAYGMVPLESLVCITTFAPGCSGYPQSYRRATDFEGAS